MKLSQAQPDDICRNRHGGNPESEVANQQTNKQRDSRMVMDALFQAGGLGMTCDELEVELGMSHQTCSARCSELKRDGKVLTTTRRRETRAGCPARVLMARTLGMART